MNKKIFQQQAQQIGVLLDDAQLDQFALYHKELLSWNEKINLVSAQSARDVVGRHFLDSLAVIPFLDRQTKTLLDIGSGAGFPGLPVKIARPDLEVHLLESHRKKVSFLKHIIRILHLEKTCVIHERAEKAAINSLRRKCHYDVVVSRATFALLDFALLSSHFLAAEGKFIALKGENVESEVIHCVNNTTVSSIFELFQYDNNADPSGKKGKIIVGEKLFPHKKTF